ncbi:capsule biosynthesis protein [Alteromonas sp. ASW11-130]|uniref:capsule biosynthesis protein n=1 Tax=Alteromonas sp. ASW11-130 TaxID=3015775 RepID=UPI002242BA52|nr:capsule biosynthesis protein [Alteromonas sp. ASW11-130]MCW8091698.1 capsule biosynthesis protein [Alteromonas sp. ASW11-130]
MKKYTSEITSFVKNNQVLLIVCIWLSYGVYLTIFAAEQFESESQLILKSSDGGNALDPSALLSTLGTSVATNESDIAIAFIQSADMAYHLDNTINLSQHYATGTYDIFSRLSANSTKEEFLEFYRDHIEVEKDSISSVITLKTRAFTPEFSNLINNAITEHTERFVNKINNDVAKAKLAFAEAEHEKIENRLRTAKTDLLAFQAKYEVLDPNMQGAALQQIAFSIEATLSQKQAELDALSSIMSTTAPEIQNIRRQIAALEKQLSRQKDKVVQSRDGKDEKSATEIMAEFSNIKIQLELTLQAFSASLLTLEKIRVETYKAFQHLVVINQPTLPEENQYPKTIYNLVLLGVVLFMVYSIIRIIIATIKEL